jgi:hypothetical protein
MFMGPPLITSQIMHVTELLLKWISRIIPYKKKIPINMPANIYMQVHVSDKEI